MSDSDLPPSDPHHERPPRAEPRLTRRSFVRAGIALGAGSALGTAGIAVLHRAEHFQRAATFIARAATYDMDLTEPILRGLVELGIAREQVRGKSILLKPNLVEPSARSPHINTHPQLVRAVAEVFRRLDAREVTIAEGAGHCRDTLHVLEQSGLETILQEDRLSFVDLNHDDVAAVTNARGDTRLERLHLPKAVLRADWVVSLPKLKTHHWAGVTLSMKNLFGIMPGLVYGWPKNVLHHRGIVESILDIAATVRPQLAIVDGIVGMEGDGPIMGTPRAAHVIVMGTNLPAVDATGARLMGFSPADLPFLRRASGDLGPVRAQHIEQRGEPIEAVAQTFALPDHPHFRQFRP